ncbi:flagellar hook-length control protein FliK [Shewanella sp. 125m-7]
MQQMNNVLLSSPEPSSKAADNHSKLAQPKINSEGDSFAAALEKAALQRQERLEQAASKSASEPKNPGSNTTNKALNTQSTAEKELAAADKAVNQANTEGKLEAADDVSQVFAQINLANNFGSDNQLAANGEDLPLESAIQASEIQESEIQATDASQLDASELSAEALMALSQQSGLSEQELSMLSTAELKNLLQQSQMLDANGELKAEFAAVHVNAGTANNLVNKDLDSSSTNKSGVTDNPLQANAIIDPKANETRDIFGKELSGISQSSDAQQLKSTKNTDENLQLNANQQASTEQLKSAELSVRMLSSQAGLESSLTNVDSNLDGTTEPKAFTGLQAQALQQQSGLTRQELPQFQLALKQVGEQTPSMQQMIQRFSPMMNQQLITMVSNGVQHAEIRLDPPELGQMMVRIQVQGDTTQVQFHVSQHQTRELVEQAMPRLREMLAEQGMQLTDGQVSQGGRNADGEQGNGHGSAHGAVETDDISAEELHTRSNLSTSSASGIDYYA